MKTLAKQILFALLALALTLSLVACGGDGNATVTTTAGDDVVTTTSPDDVQTDATTTTVDGAEQPSGQASGSASKTSATTKAQGNNTKKLTWAQVKANMPASLRGTTITFYNWNEMKSITEVEKNVTKFTNETGIKVDWQLGSYEKYVTEIAADQKAGKAPDIVRMKEVNPALMAMLQPLSVTGYDFSDAAWDQSLMDMYSYKGTAYAANLADTLMQQPDVLFYTTQMIKKYGLEDPFALWKKGQWTWDKFVEICTIAKEEADNDNFIAYTPFKWQVAAQLMGTDFVKYTGKGYTDGMSDPKLLKGMQMLIEMKQDGLLSSLPWQEAAFEAGNVLFFHDAIIGARKTHFYFVDYKNAGILAAVPLPEIKGQTNYQLFAELEAYAVPKGAKNAAAVPYFLRYFLDAENYDEQNFFANRNIYQVYQHCMSNKNRFMTYNASAVLTKDTGISQSQLTEELMKSPVAQVRTVLDRNRPKVASAVKQANDIMAPMG